MRGSSGSGRVASLLALLLLSQGLLGAFARLPAAAANLELCTGEGIVRLVPAPRTDPAAPDRAHCVLCLLPASLAAVEPAALPLPTSWPRDRVVLAAIGGSAPARPRPSWPRAPPRG